MPFAHPHTLCHTKQASPWSNSSASHVVNYSRVYLLARRDRAIKRPFKHCGHLTSLSKSNLGNFQHHSLSELLVALVIMYSNRLMVKSSSCCCVCWSWLISDPVTYGITVHSIGLYFVLYFHVHTVRIVTAMTVDPYQNWLVLGTSLIWAITLFGAWDFNCLSVTGSTLDTEEQVSYIYYFVWRSSFPSYLDTWCLPGVNQHNM